MLFLASDRKNWLVLEERDDFVMDKEQVFQAICDSGLLAVVRAKDADQAIKIAEACRLGGS